MRPFSHLTPHYIVNKAMAIVYEKRHPDHPWLTRQANSLLSTLLKPTDVGLEWGSGRSTSWFAQRIKHLTSVEHDEAWYKEVSGRIKSANILNVNYLFRKLAGEYEKPDRSPYVQVANIFTKNSLDFVLVDGRYRDICANMALEKICSGGIIVIDNANWYLPCDSFSPGSIPQNSPPASEAWGRFLDRVKDWRLIWTSNGVWDTAIWFRPADSMK